MLVSWSFVYCILVSWLTDTPFPHFIPHTQVGPITVPLLPKLPPPPKHQPGPPQPQAKAQAASASADEGKGKGKGKGKAAGGGGGGGGSRKAQNIPADVIKASVEGGCGYDDPRWHERLG